MIFASFLPGQSGLVQHSSTIVPFHAVGAPHEGHIESLLHTTVYSSEAAGLMVERIFGITPPERVTRISAPLANCFVLMKAALYPVGFSISQSPVSTVSIFTTGFNAPALLTFQVIDLTIV